MPVRFDRNSSQGQRNRSLVKILGGLAVTGVVLGLSVGLLGAGFVNALGISGSDTPVVASAPAETKKPAEPSATATPSSPPPKTKPTTASPPPKTKPTTASPPPKTKPPRQKKPDEQGAELVVTPTNASPGSRISMTGTVPGVAPGTSLQVQRLEGGAWTDFPVSVTVAADGTFSTYIITDRTGAAWFRLSNGTDSTPRARVRIG
ncbi:MAG: hypothetical protein WKF83_00100 [Nocardioidaceae bacterium]